MLDSGNIFKTKMFYNVSIHSRPIRRLTEAADGEGACGLPSLKGKVTEKDFTGFSVLSTPLFPLKGEVSNRKGIFDEKGKKRRDAAAGSSSEYLVPSYDKSGRTGMAGCGV